ncbi:hypothetical protein KC19_VG254800 [Ceratodon purpureus]|uniref:Uncharacterized protein n=1 Tax=Ceratodon purpureus TaxID=3225 RepID=A0A8T0HU55_CERPU|nr:hypothetical protein KC19_VG254800 [Ceratodon purpureus]
MISVGLVSPSIAGTIYSGVLSGTSGSGRPRCIIRGVASRAIHVSRCTYVLSNPRTCNRESSSIGLTSGQAGAICQRPYCLRQVVNFLRESVAKFEFLQHQSLCDLSFTFDGGHLCLRPLQIDHHVLQFLRTAASRVDSAPWLTPGARASLESMCDGKGHCRIGD